MKKSRVSRVVARWISSVLTCCLLLMMLPVQVWATDIVDSGYCGGEANENNVTWSLDNKGLLIISGEGDMANYNDDFVSPWYENRHNVNNVIIEDGVTSIGDFAFYECPLTSIIIPDGVTSIGNWSLCDCYGLTQVEIPDSVRNIGIRAFSLSSLEEVTFGNNLNSIGEGAFQECYNLTSVTIPDSVTNIGDGEYGFAFAGCFKLAEIKVGLGNNYYTSINGVLYDKFLTKLIRIPDGKDINNYTIPDGVKSIGSYSLGGKLEEITIPLSVTNFDDNAFSWDTFSYDENLKIIYYAGTIEQWSLITGNSNVPSYTTINYQNMESEINCGVAGENITWQVDGDTLLITGSGNMYSYESDDKTPWYSYQDKIKTIDIQSGVTNIGNHAFDGCVYVANVTIPNSISKIGDFAFNGCDALTTVGIPDSVTDIGFAAFLGCLNLSDVNYGGSKANWWNINIAENNEALTSANIHFGVVSSYTTTFSPNGGTGTMADIKFNDETTIDLPECGFAPPDGKLFKAWSINGVEYQPGASYKFDEDTTVVAVWYSLSDFNRYIYQANYLSNLDNPAPHTTQGYMYDIKTPSQVYVQAGKENGLEVRLNAWRIVTEAGDAVNNPSGVVDIPLEYKDIYSAVILNILQSSSSAKYLDMQYINGVKDASKFVASVNDVLKAYTVETSGAAKSFKEIYDLLPEGEKDHFLKSFHDSIKDVFKSNQPDLYSMGDTLDKVTKSLELLDTVMTAQDYYNRVLSCMLIAKQCQAYRDTINEAYRLSLSTHNLYLQGALYDCKTMIEAENDDVLRKAMTGQSIVLGKKAFQFIFKELYWNGAKSLMKASCPGVWLLLASYSGSKLITNALFKTDAIKKNFSTLKAVEDIEKLFFDTNSNLRNRYLADPSEQNAKAFINSFDIVYFALNEDCEQAKKYITTIEEADWFSGLGDNAQSYESARNQILGIQSSYTSEYDMVLREWIYSLSTDYPRSGLEEFYTDYFNNVPMGILRKEVKAACPVDIYIYNQEGEIVASVIGDVVSCTDESIMIAKLGEEKTVQFFDDQEYRIEYVGSDNGKMDVTVSEFADDETTRKVNYYDMALTNEAAYSMEFDSAVNEEHREYEIKQKENNELVPHDYDSNEENASNAVSVASGSLTRNGESFFSTTASTNERLALNALVPVGYVFDHWDTTGADAQDVIADTTNPSTFLTMPNKPLTIQAVLLAEPVSICWAELSSDGDERIVSCKIHCEQSDFNAFGAFYNSNGQLLDLELIPLKSDGDNYIDFSTSKSGIAELRVFILNNNYVPQCSAGIFVLQ